MSISYFFRQVGDVLLFWTSMYIERQHSYSSSDNS